MDSWGSGNFGASRTRDGKAHPHNGLDLVTVVGDTIVAPISGKVDHIGIAYPESDLGSIHIQGSGEFVGMRVKILYCRPDPGIGGKVVETGDRLGEAQDVSGYWAAKQPGHSGVMRNHIHLETWLTDAQAVSPAQFMPEGLVVSPDLTA
jgi:hypothetical protein